MKHTNTQARLTNIVSAALPPPPRKPESGTFAATPATTSVTSRVDIALANAIDAAAAAAGLTRSEAIAYVLRQAFAPTERIPVPAPKPAPEPMVRVRVPASLVPPAPEGSRSAAVVDILRRAAGVTDPRSE